MTEYKTWIKEVFDAASPSYGEEGASFFNYFGQALVHYAVLSEGEHVLDVACGKGAVAFPAAERVGPEGRVVAIDFSEKMIEEAKRKKACDWLEFYAMDAEALVFEDESFDVVLCGFGLFFFPDVQKALAEFKRVLKPGGCLALSIWGKKPALDRWVAQRAKELGACRKLHLVPLENAERLTACLEEAGFTEIEVNEETQAFEQKDPQSWWASILSHGTLGLYEQLSSENKELLKKEAIEKATSEGCLMQERQAIYAACEKALVELT
jgi:ubiquinone/menaquinone biosynthesis C-methylase UbiE